MSDTTSSSIAADPRLVPLWDGEALFPSPEEMPDLRIVTHVSVERGQPDTYRYLHETAVAFHGGRLYFGWANHRTHEMNIADEILRGVVSEDQGLHWSAPQIWAEPPLEDSESMNQPVLISHQDRLWGFFTSWHGGPAWQHCRPRMNVFLLNEGTDRWEATGARIPGFLPFQPPRRMGDGNWIMGGENFWYEAAVAISRGDDFTSWQVIPIPPGPDEIRFPETTVIDHGDHIVAVCRPRGTPSALVAESRDFGRTWTPLLRSNFPVGSSKLLAGSLSTGQHYLITNNFEAGRSLLSIAVTTPGGSAFCRIWKIRHQKYPVRRLYPGPFFEGEEFFNYLGKSTEWSYPAATEHDGRLFVSYSQGKEDGVLSIIPLEVLAVE